MASNLLRSSGMVAGQDSVFEEFAREFIRRRERPRAHSFIDRILTPTDFSRCSLAAIEYAEELARRFGAELLLVHATGVPSMPAEVSPRRRDDVARILADTVERLRSDGIRARGVIRPGAPAEEIRWTAAAEHASLIVMGTHGRSGVARVVMGSVAELVVRTAGCPVLTVGPAAG
jgi:universal stress protein A